MGPEGIILVNPPITTLQQSLTHSALTHVYLVLKRHSAMIIPKRDTSGYWVHGPHSIHVCTLTLFKQLSHAKKYCFYKTKTELLGSQGLSMAKECLMRGKGLGDESKKSLAGAAADLQQRELHK